MRHRIPAAVLAAVTGLTLAGLVAGPAEAARRPATVKAAAVAKITKPKPYVVSGSVAAVDAAAETLTVAWTTRAGTATLVVTVGATAAVMVDGVPATLADLPVGARVTVNGRISAGVRTVTKVRAVTTWPFWAAGAATVVDDLGATITLDADDPIAVDPAATVVVDGVAATLADVPAGARVRVWGTATNGARVATAVNAVTSWRVRVYGKLTVVDADAAAVTVQTGRTTTETFAVDPAAKVRVNGIATTLATLPVGALVTVTGTEYADGTVTASAVDVYIPKRKRR
jgi:hypothetical protein